MVERKWLTGTIEAGWILLVVGGVIAAYTGNAEPFVAAGDLPGGESANKLPYMVGIAVGLSVAGLALGTLLKGDQWAAMAEETELTPDDSGGLLGEPDLVGTVRGRPVRARTVSRKVQSADRGNNRKTFTVVETQLDEPTAEAMMLSRRPAGTDPEKVELSGGRAGNEAVDDRFAVVGGVGEEVAERVLTGRARNKLIELDDVGTLTVGDPTGEIMDRMPDMSDSMVGSFFEGQIEGKLAERSPGSRGTVAIQTPGTLRDSDELSRQVDTVVSVADADEDSSAAEK